MLPAQLLIVYNHWRVNIETCASDLMATPEAAAAVHSLSGALDFLQASTSRGSIGWPAWLKPAA